MSYLIILSIPADLLYQFSRIHVPASFVKIWTNWLGVLQEGKESRLHCVQRQKSCSMIVYYFSRNKCDYWVFFLIHPPDSYPKWVSGNEGVTCGFGHGKGMTLGIFPNWDVGIVCVLFWCLVWCVKTKLSFFCWWLQTMRKAAFEARREEILGRKDKNIFKTTPLTAAEMKTVPSSGHFGGNEPAVSFKSPPPQDFPPPPPPPESSRWLCNHRPLVFIRHTIIIKWYRDYVYSS